MVNWTSDKDQIILKGIFKFHDIKNSKPLLDYLAQEIGEGCTPKAVSHRLSNLRSSGKPVSSTNPVSTPRKAPATPRTPRNPATGRLGAKMSKAKKTTDPETSSEDENDQPVTTPTIGRKKRGRGSTAPKSYAESDATTGDEEDDFTPMAKRVKTEPVEEEGVAGVDAPVEDEDEGVDFI